MAKYDLIHLIQSKMIVCQILKLRCVNGLFILHTEQVHQNFKLMLLLKYLFMFKYKFRLNLLEIIKETTYILRPIYK